MMKKTASVLAIAAIASTLMGGAIAYHPAKAMSITQKGEEKPSLLKQELPAAESEEVKLTIEDVVFLAVENNRDIKNAYLDRIVQRGDLEIAEDIFVPNLTPQFSIDSRRNAVGASNTDTRNAEISAEVSSRIPTGGELRVQWRGTGQNQETNALSGVDENSLTQNLQLSFEQPLFRGFGIDVNRASIEIARLNEANNILSLKSTIINTITNAIQRYRALLRAQEQLKIGQLALESAKRQLEITKAFVEAGRRAPVDIVEAEANVANREVDLLANENGLKAARSNLIEILDIDRNQKLVAGETPDLESPTSLEPSQLLQVALVNNPDYLRSQLRQKTAKFDLLLAEDRARSDLNLNIGYSLNSGNRIENTTDLRAGLTFSRDFGRQRQEEKQDVNRRRINLQQTQIDLQETRESLEIEVKDRIRDIEVDLRRVELARKARELSEQQFENEREKLRLGVQGTRLVDVLNSEDELVRARNRELDAIISYLDDLTRLEQTLGITLQRWNVSIDVNRS
ncbi:MAG: TolC family protein [Hormoscilla sp. GUM202]|nr:TolC family protein [Hormoscilla sp. GUM202]